MEASARLGDLPSSTTATFNDVATPAVAVAEGFSNSQIRLASS